MATGNNFMSGPAQAYANRTLPSDQQSMQDGLAKNAQAATDVANLAVGARDATRLGVGTANFGSKLLTGKNLINGAMMANRFNVPVLTYTLADYGVKEARSAMGYTDGKGLSDLIGDSLGGYVADKMYGAQNERNSKPFTQEELDAYRANMFKSPSPSTSPATAGFAGSISDNPPSNSTSPTLVDSDPLTEKARQEFLDGKRQYELDNATLVDSDPMTPKDDEEMQRLLQMQGQDQSQKNLELMRAALRSAPQLEEDISGRVDGGGLQNLQQAYNANGQMGIGIAPQVGQLSDAEIMEQRQLRALEQENSGGLANAYSQGGVDPRALQFAGGGMRPDGIESYSGITASGNKLPIDREALEAFQKNQESQNSASGLMRQEFNSTPMISDTPEAGMVSFIDANGKLTYGNETAKQMYSADAIENRLSERFKAEQAPQGTETPLEAPAVTPEGSTPSGSPEDSPAPVGTPDSEKTQEQIEYERQIAEDDESLMKWARDNNKSPEYVEKMMEGIVERREEAQKEKSLKDLLAELQIEKLRLGNRMLEKELGVGSRHEDVDMREVERLYEMMENQGVKVDPNTGGMSTLEDNLNPFSEGTKQPLHMFSALFQQLAQTPAGRYILDTPPPEIAIIKNPEVGMYDADDGRVFSFDGESWSVLTSLGGFNDPLVNDEEE